jgi:IMP cyclohydrolase
MGMELEALVNMEYPGRVIIIGMNPHKERIVLYAITGRSPSSQARKIESYEDEKALVFNVKPTDEDVLRKGDPALLTYPAIYASKEGLIVSNGRQTSAIQSELAENGKPMLMLMNALEHWEYEPDAPNFTPRISGVVNQNGAAMSIIKRAKNGSAVRSYFEIPLIPGKGRMLTTYTGENKDPLPAFRGEPVEVNLPFEITSDAVNVAYESLAPRIHEPDYRVSVAGIFLELEGLKNVYDIINHK